MDLHELYINQTLTCFPGICFARKKARNFFIYKKIMQIRVIQILFHVKKTITTKLYNHIKYQNHNICLHWKLKHLIWPNSFHVYKAFFHYSNCLHNCTSIGYYSYCLAMYSTIKNKLEKSGPSSLRKVESTTKGQIWIASNQI